MSRSLWASGEDQNDDYFAQRRSWPGWLGTDVSPVLLEPRIERAATTLQQACSAANNLCFVLALLLSDMP